MRLLLLNGNMPWSFILGTWRPIVWFNRCEFLHELYVQALSRVQQYNVADYRYSAAQRIYRSNPSFLVDLSCLLVTSLAFSSSPQPPTRTIQDFTILIRVILIFIHAWKWHSFLNHICGFLIFGCFRFASGEILLYLSFWACLSLTFCHLFSDICTLGFPFFKKILRASQIFFIVNRWNFSTMCFDHINFPLLHLLSDPSSHFLSFFFSLKETKNVESSFCFHIIQGVGLSTGAWLPCQRWASVMALNKTVSASTVSHLLPTAYSQGWDFTSPFPSMPGLRLDLVEISHILSEPCVFMGVTAILCPENTLSW